MLTRVLQLTCNVFFSPNAQMFNRLVPPEEKQTEPHRQSFSEDADGRRLLGGWQIPGDGRVRPPAVGAHLGPGRSDSGGRICWTQIRSGLRGELLVLSLNVLLDGVLSSCLMPYCYMNTVMFFFGCLRVAKRIPKSVPSL